MKILFISSYPTIYKKSKSVFVYRLVQALIEQGCQIVVISPQIWREKREEFKSEPKLTSYGIECAIVYRPFYFDLPNVIRAGNFTLGRYNAYTYRRAVKKTLRQLDFEPDIVYSHFLYRSGPAAIFAAKYFKVPAIVALGESSLDKHAKIFTEKKMHQLIRQFSAILSVSHKNKEYAINRLGVKKNRIKVIPNAVNPKVFYPRNKKKMREKYKLPHKTFIIAFVGHYIERKGPLRVLKAIDQLKGDIGGIFLGSGKQEPTGKKVLFNGRVSYDQVPELLSAADIFVLPTQNEGSCNAIFEAMACGLPIVSSDIEAVREQVTEHTALLADPNNIEELSSNIKMLYQNRSLLRKMRTAALEAIANNTTEKRAVNIRSYLEETINQFE